ncbi:hypothetical protein FOZ61_009864 [Perkinsus olseni]|uniref:Uncharacterized protein n=1 Tax=Perkinsus olseni TaxID=32597 RepID=A0A7J6L082_PEROL|nr:hypothetical protein FOZ61_009864 [Perkinsus olseni]
MSSDLFLKLRTRTQTMRVRVDSEKLTDMCQIKGYIEKSWSQLQGKQYRIYYIDEIRVSTSNEAFTSITFDNFMLITQEASS